ncbi:hypothetical protein CTKZ_19880 [Cellulomonas algicola]|uniref:Nucleotidyl transferase AbiEii/AbiGii toxin family protein n=1 Tax=Cellulomonas algicola TaxID=2071633 RepID=A0A401V0G5_9CELL|nr:nucleotidyl transferase AbiEii/AbiGii toxin family protein [Cellulomonas algicola]GCD20426.1 hypothetical protein CTKZ_19880 [Cellulomonas algicola]
MRLDPGELYDVADAFGVDLDQVRRDHVISHVLASIARRERDRFVFYGGTALSRTWTPDARLSEDVDLLVRGSRAEAGRALAAALAADLGPHVPSLSWSKPPGEARDAEAVFLLVGDDVTIKFQLASVSGRPAWPTEPVEVVQRYGDAPPARLHVPTRAAAAAMKLAAWSDRRAARDLYDLWELQRRGLVDAAAVHAWTHFGPSSRPPGAWIFASVPSERDWRDQLGHQTRLDVTARDAARAVEDAWTRAAGG